MRYSASVDKIREQLRKTMDANLWPSHTRSRTCTHTHAGMPISIHVHHTYTLKMKTKAASVKEKGFGLLAKSLYQPY